jgi:ABC-type nitrate/sulfonate/bicarbonate transport system permease component
LESVAEQATAPLQSIRPRESRLRQTLGDAFLALLGVGILIGFWWLLAAQLPDVRLPAPNVVWQAMIDNFSEMPALTYATYQEGGIGDGLLYTAENVAIGVGIGLALGIAVGLLMARVRIVGALLELPLVLLGTIPVLILLPFIVTWFGTARIAQTGLVIFFTFVTLTAVVQNAATNVAGSYENFAASLGARDRLVLRDIVWPATIPEILGACRVCVGAAWGFEVIAEILGAQHGAGRIIQAMGTTSATPELMATVLALAIVAVIVDFGLMLVARWSARWTE